MSIVARESHNLPDFYQGETVPMAIEITDPVTGDAVDITGWVFETTVKSTLAADDADADLQTSTTAPADSVSEGGLITLYHLTSTATAQLSPGSYYIDVTRSIAGSPPDVAWVVPTQQISVLKPANQP